ncbi:sulfatase-like hydrolase/transferase [Neolewinella lacunae]|uniref:Sulfatase-like hydrolase/transferase n=1 Tax=Neolewinella lacunae TaxID=1517758 RepID=A0A923PKJ6_9BACT|nr:sulfatase-like hydrolase/transferase [Neolewinella lacunae]MBC6994250.1 sulfatase-like hydrolase/transferase [Neolewinella lacunae]MDN3637132.1 sulfatase-like hydrolase/transferase [Neolewinella lacunae]
MLTTCTAPAAAPSVVARDISVPQPNILFIFSDDLSFRDLSAYGQRNYATPHLDALVRRSTRFTQAYTAAPECAPSRGCLLTGKHVGRGPIRINSSARGFEPLPAGSNTFAEKLQQAGYRTGVVGKWGVGYRGSTGEPLRQGFDYHFGYLSHYEAHSYFPLELFENEETLPLRGNDAFPLETLYAKKGTENKASFAEMYNASGKLEYLERPGATYAPDLMDQKAAAFIEENKDRPFFLFFTTNLPHGPSIVDDLRAFSTREEMDINSREWGAMVQRLDESVGRLIAQLKATGTYDNTVIVFASDNGYSMHNPKQDVAGEQYWPDDPWLLNKGPFLGGKFSVREGGMRVPFFVSMPGQLESRVVSTPVWLVDLYPTFVRLAGGEVPADLDGVALQPLLGGGAGTFPEERPFYFYKNNEQSVRKGAWFGWRAHPAAALEVYLPEEDQACAFDLAGVYPAVAAELSQYLDTVHQDHPWYWNPGERAEDYQAKIALAEKTGQIIPRYRPNRMARMPWERK